MTKSENFTDKQNDLIALKEYRNYKVGDPINIDGYGKIGYVSQVVDNKWSGEYTYVITDKKVTNGASAKDVKNVTVISRGSNSQLNSWDEVKKTSADWLENNVPIATQVLINETNMFNPNHQPIPHPFSTALPQMRTSAGTVNRAMEKYKNADFSLYGHSQGSMNMQYAAADAEFPSRIKSVHVYEGPNIYSLLNPKQKNQANKLYSKIYNITDPKDLIPWGYRTGKPTVGRVIRAKSKWKINPIDQHMMEGYQFKNGKLITKSGILDGLKKKPKKKIKKKSAKKVSKQASSNSKLNKLSTKTLKQKFGAGGLTDSQKILLDAVYAREATQSALTDITAKTTEFKKMYADAIKEANNLWDDTVAQAAMMGPHLSKSEQLGALASAGFTETEVKTQPSTKYQSKIEQLTAFQSKYETLLEKIDTQISKQVSGDQELAKMFSL